MNEIPSFLSNKSSHLTSFSYKDISGLQKLIQSLNTHHRSLTYLKHPVQPSTTASKIHPTTTTGKYNLPISSKIKHHLPSRWITLEPTLTIVFSIQTPQSLRSHPNRHHYTPAVIPPDYNSNVNNYLPTPNHQTLLTCGLTDKRSTQHTITRTFKGRCKAALSTHTSTLPFFPLHIPSIQSDTLNRRV